MGVRQEYTSGEVKRLQRCLNDLVSVLALPAMWSGSQPSQIVHTLLDALLAMLCLDLVYARFEDPAGGEPIEVLKIAPSATWMLPDEIHKTLNQWSGDDPQKWPSRLRASIGDEDVSMVSQRCGLHGEIGVIVAGSQRADFPEQAETLSLASNQTKIQLVLRNPLDTAINTVPGTAMVNLFADQAAPKVVHVAARPKVVPKAPPAFSIEVINGNKRSEAKFGTPGGTQ